MTSHVPLRGVHAQRHTAQERTSTEEWLAEETPVAFVYNGRSHAVMMATPDDLDDFAYGFTLTEGIVERVDEIEIVDRLHVAHGISLQMLIPQRYFDALDHRERAVTGRTGCGLCGTSTLEAAIRPVRHVVDHGPMLREVLSRGFEQLETAQRLNRAAGAVHAAGLITDDGAMLVREDVGRHNAVDKVMGAAARAGRCGRALLVTSRASYEIVHKAAQMGCPVVAAVSAPTALAVRIADEAGVCLIGFARDGRMTVYTRAATLA